MILNDLLQNKRIASKTSQSSDWRRMASEQRASRDLDKFMLVWLAQARGKVPCAPAALMNVVLALTHIRNERSKHGYCILHDNAAVFIESV